MRGGTRIVIDQTVSPAFCKGGACASFGDAGQYEASSVLRSIEAQAAVSQPGAR